MKKICFFSGDITRDGGTERVATLIANTLAARGQSEICFLSLVEQNDRPFFELNEKIRRYRLGDHWINPGPGYLKVLVKLARFLKQEKPDVIIDIDIVLDVLTVPLCKRFHKTVKGMPAIVSWGHFAFSYEQASLYRRMILKCFTMRTDYCVTINEENRRCYADILKRRSGLCTIYNPIKPASPVAFEERKREILWVGHLLESKGTDHLMAIAKRVMKKHPEWTWVVVGAGPEEETLRRFARDCEGVGQFLVTGAVKNIDARYRDAGIFVLTSHSEGLPMCLLEAKQFGIPAVSFALEGMEEIVRDGQNGFLVKPFDCEAFADRVCELIEKEDLRRSFSQESGLDMERFDIDKIADDWSEVFQKVCR